AALRPPSPRQSDAGTKFRMAYRRWRWPRSFGAAQKCRLAAEATTRCAGEEIESACEAPGRDGAITSLRCVLLGRPLWQGEDEVCGNIASRRARWLCLRPSSVIHTSKLVTEAQSDGAGPADEVMRRA